MKLKFLASNAPKAQSGLALLQSLYSHHDDNPDVLVVLGGDGFIIETLRSREGQEIPVYGMNLGTLGFLLNGFSEIDLEERIARAQSHLIHPLSLEVIHSDDSVSKGLAINDISVLRSAPQAANLEISVNGKVRMDNLVGDGIIISTPVGSTAYNASAGGPILPLGTNALAITPIAPFRPRRWRGAIIPQDYKLDIRPLDRQKRPVSVSSDGVGYDDVSAVKICLDTSRHLHLLFDPENGLTDKVLCEQFA